VDTSAQPPAPKMLLLKPNMIAPISATSPSAVSDISITPIDELLLNKFSKRRNHGCLAIQLYVENRVVCAVLHNDRLVCEAPKSVPPTTDARSSPSRSFQRVMRFSRFPSTDHFWDAGGAHFRETCARRFDRPKLDLASGGSPSASRTDARFPRVSGEPSIELLIASQGAIVYDRLTRSRAVPAATELYLRRQGNFP
jgi:hypothetical protein